MTKVQKAKAMMTKASKKKLKSFKKILKNGKESFNGTLKPITMGCCQKEAQSWEEVLEGKFELKFYIVRISF